MQPQQYCLKWKYHNSNIQTTFALLRDRASYCDVTLWCGGAAMRAHRAVLAACSGLFAELLANHDAAFGEPSLILTDSVHAYHLRHLLAFMYTGEVNVHHSELETLLRTAEELQIKGLADVSWKDSNDSNENSTPTGTEISVAPCSTDGADTSVPKKDNEGSKVTIKKGPVSVVSSKSVNGSVLLPVMSNERPRRRRGRPPLEPKNNTIEKEIIIPDGPKRPNILRKSKPADQKADITVAEITPNWGSGNQENETEDLLSEYSEASLDGQDISHFLDTTMEEPGEILPKNISGDKSMTIIPPTNMSSDEPAAGQCKENQSFSDVVKLSDYLLSGRRTQFWTEDYVKRVMEAVFCRELEMKQAAEILGVSYGTLYGRYRDTFGCINRPYRAREFWAENSDILAKLQRQELTFLKAAELLNITPQMLFTYVNTVAEPIINQQEASDIFTDAIARANAKTDIKTNSDIEAGKEDGDKNDESYNLLSDIFRKQHEQEDFLQEPVVKLEPNITIEDSSASDASEVDQPEAKKSKTSTDEVVEISDDQPKSEPSSSAVTSPSVTTSNPKKLPMIRVANLKFLKGEPPGPVNLSELGDKNNPIVFKTMSSLIRSDMKMMSSKRKVTFEEIEHSLKQSKIISTSSIVKPPASIT